MYYLLLQDGASHLLLQNGTDALLLQPIGFAASSDADYVETVGNEYATGKRIRIGSS